MLMYLRGTSETGNKKVSLLTTEKRIIRRPHEFIQYIYIRMCAGSLKKPVRTSASLVPKQSSHLDRGCTVVVCRLIIWSPNQGYP